MSSSRSWKPLPLDTCTECWSASTTLKRCSVCQVSMYCSSACQKKSRESHERFCVSAPSLPTGPPPAPIAAVQVSGPNFEPKAITVPPGHPVWSQGSIAPVSQFAGIPLFVYRDTDKKEQNQSATYMMIAPESGLAPLRWDRAGTVTVVRADHEPLTPVALEMYWMFCSKLISMCPDDEADAQKMCNPNDFQAFCREYKEGGASQEYKEGEGSMNGVGALVALASASALVLAFARRLLYG
ncbi:unnamed protein product [Peniophora sp. CBMAI 1063]|nr:unnamed protein product [Peniophora sp. CBMAI 1063]